MTTQIPKEKQEGEVELLPCPFCGNFMNFPPELRASSWVHNVKCDGCGATTKAHLWNTRTPNPKAGGVNLFLSDDVMKVVVRSLRHTMICDTDNDDEFHIVNDVLSVIQSQIEGAGE